MLVHDEACGMAKAQRKELLQLEIEKQIELGEEGLDKQDWWLLDINLISLENSLGEDQYYWMVSIQVASEDQRPERTEKNIEAEEPQRRQAY